LKYQRIFAPFFPFLYDALNCGKEIGQSMQFSLYGTVGMKKKPDDEPESVYANA